MNTFDYEIEEIVQNKYQFKIFDKKEPTRVVPESEVIHLLEKYNFNVWLLQEHEENYKIEIEFIGTYEYIDSNFDSARIEPVDEDLDVSEFFE